MKHIELLNDDVQLATTYTMITCCNTDNGGGGGCGNTGGCTNTTCNTCNTGCNCDSDNY